MIIVVLIFVSIVFSPSVFSQVESPYRIGKLKHRISIGPVISSYKNDSHHTVNTKGKPGFNAAYKSELILSRKTNLLLGLEYMNQRFSFNGYYVAPFHTYLFDQSFSYYHEIHYQEIQMPLSIKIAFNAEKDKPSTAYTFLGAGFRYIAKSTAFIQSDSTQETMFDGVEDLTFENHVVQKNFNSFFEAGLGLQKNFRTNAKAFFFEFTYKYSVSRLHYTGYRNSNDLNIRDANLTIAIGFRF